jgi:hypothetical protein
MSKPWLHVAVAVALGAQLLAARPAAAVQAIEDHLPQFITSIGDGSVDYWMAYEAANSRELDTIFYRDRSAAQKSALARQALAHYVPIRQLTTFANNWRADFEWVAERLEGLSGRLPFLTASMWYTYDTRPYVFAEIGGKQVMGLNARLFLPYTRTRTRLILCDAFFSTFQFQQPRDMAERMTLGRRVQVDGLRMAVQQRGVPGLPAYGYMHISPATLQTWQRNQKSIARALLAALDGPESANSIDRFFGRGGGDHWPAPAGRYMAYMLALGAAREHNPLELVTMPSRDYLFVVRPQLEDMARVQEGLSP